MSILITSVAFVVELSFKDCILGLNMQAEILHIHIVGWYIRSSLSTGSAEPESVFLTRTFILIHIDS